MKKYINKIAILGLALGITCSCETDDKVVDEILAQVGTGGILRTRDEVNNLDFNDETNAFDDGASYTLVIEEQDEQGGALLESVEVYVNFDDNSDEGPDMSTEEVLLQTLAASDFTAGERSLPETTITYTADELIAATGITESLVIGKDRFEFRLVLTLTNGETYTNTDVGGPVSGGSYFAAPFEYFPVVGCTITESLAGTHSYVATGITPAPGGGGDCSGGDLNGTVTWTETESGVYSSTDMGFGQFDDCYPGRGAATGDDITIEWDCTNLIPDGDVFLNKAGVVIPNDDNDDDDVTLTYSYTVTTVTGPEMTIAFSNSAGDRGTVVLTREGGADWPIIFTENNP